VKLCLYSDIKDDLREVTHVNGMAIADWLNHSYKIAIIIEEAELHGIQEIPGDGLFASDDLAIIVVGGEPEPEVNVIGFGDVAKGQG
jgi:hypothetical protein